MQRIIATKRHKLGKSLLIRLIGVCMFIAASFMMVVALRVRIQNERISHEFIAKSFRVVIDDILSRREKLLTDVVQFAESAPIRTAVGFLADYKTESAGSLYFTQDTYRQLAGATFAMGQASGVWKLMTYDMNGDLVSFYQNDSSGGYYGYAIGFPEPVFVVNNVKSVNDSKEKNWRRTDIEAISVPLNHDLKAESFYGFKMIDGILGIISQAPIFIDVFDRNQEKTIQSQVGVAVAVIGCDGGGEERLSTLTGTMVRFITDRAIADRYRRMVKTGTANTADKQPDRIGLDTNGIVFDETEGTDGRFFEGGVPIEVGPGRHALISVRYATDTAEENTRQMVLYLLLVSVCCVFMIVPVALFFSRRLVAPIESLALTVQAIQGGRLDAMARVYKNDEIGELAKAFNSMAANIQRLLRDLYQEKERLRKFEHIVAASQDMIALIDRNYVHEAVNDSLLTAFNRTREEILGRTVSEVIGESLFHAEAKRWIDTAFSGQTVHYEDQLMLPSGERMRADVTYSPFFDEKGNVTYVVFNARDLTEAKKLEEQLMQSQRMESIGTLAGGVAHEINNPINGIMNYAQLIFDNAEEGGSEKLYAQEIIIETRRIAQIVRNLLTFARNEKQYHSPALVSDIISSVLTLIQTVIRHDQISLEIDIPETLPKIKCRSQQIQQVLMNLMINGRDALNERYPGYNHLKKLRIYALSIEKQDRPFLRITVEDFGIGIPPDIQKRIFDPFFTTKSKELGTGLGLSISYGIVKDHGGEILVESVPGEGTRFHVDLPVNNGWSLMASETEGG